MNKRILAILLALALLISCLPMGVMAEGAQEADVPVLAEETTAPVVIPEAHGHSAAHTCEDCQTDITWTAWTKTTELPKTSGHYYLTADVKVSSRYNVSGSNDVVLCLNGYNVDGQAKTAIYQVSDTAKLTILDCTAYTDAEGNYHAGALINGKDANLGGAIYAIGKGTFQMFGGKLTGHHNTQTSSSMGWSGGAIHGRGNAVIILKNMEISGNHTTAEGGAICLRETDATGDTAAAAYLENVTLKDNVADRKGGAIFLNNAKNSITLKNCTIENNYCKGSGGAVYSNYGTVTLEGNTFLGNACANGGGAVHMCGGTLTIESGLFDGTREDATANAKYGGSLYLSAGASATLKNGEFKNHTVSDFGGVVFMKESKTILLMQGGTFRDNSGRNGGAITAETGSTFKMTGGTITGNTASSKGGVIYLNGKGVNGYFDGGQISGNSANNGGVAYQEANANTIHLRGGKFTENTAKTHGGAVYTNTGTTLKLSGSPEVTGNTAAGKTENIWLPGSNVLTVGNMGEGTAKVGITADQSTLPRAISGEISSDCSKYFVSDSTYRAVTFKDNKLYMDYSADHNHCDCVNIGGSHCNHTQVVWRPWESTTTLPTASGYYFLTANVKTTGRQSVTGSNDVHLCLNGYTVDGSQKIIYHTKDTASLTITDCTAHTDEQGNYIAGSLTNASDTNVGALYAENGTITMFGGKLTGNHNTQTAEAAGWSGGAIHARGDAKLLLVGTELSDNHTTAEGGAICLRGNATAVLEKVTFRGNTADRKGGAVYLSGKANHMTLKNCVFEENSVTGDAGGAILLNGGALTVTDCVFTNNTAKNNAGAIITTGGKLTIENSTFTGNTGKDGGALRLTGGCEATIKNSTFTGNHATASGGAISSADSNLTLENNKINENISDGTAGALIFAGKDKVLTLVSGEFNGNTAAAAGGAMLVQSYAKLDMKDGTFTGNASTGGDGGAMYISTNCTGVIENCTVTGNTAQKYAGGIMLFGSNIIMNNGLISGNTAANGAGVTGRSGIRTEDGNQIRDVGAVFIMNGGKITENVASTGDGGGLQFAGDNCAATINGGEISGNTASSGGGIIAMTNAVITINDGKISGNTASRNGGGLFMSFTSVLNINGGEFSGNKASNGGGIYLYGASVTLTGGKITKNTAKDNSGGIGGGGCTQNGVRYRSVLNMKDVTIAENTGTNYGGIGLVMTDIQMESGTVITGNYAQKAVGGMVIMTDSTMKMTGGIISYNTAAEAANGGLYISSRSTLTMTGGTICYNQCKNDGGGVYLQQSTGYFYGGSIVGNRSNEGNGGGMRVGGSTVYLYGTSIKDNYAKASGGGVIAARFKNTGENKDYMPYITIDGSTISGNKSDGPAGGMVLQAPGQTVFKSGVVENNESAGNGGGIYVSTNHTFEMSGGEIRNNKANQGAGVYHLASIGNYTGGKITGNEAVKNGGGMVFTGASKIDMKDMELSDNSGWQAGAIIVNNENAVMTAENCTFLRNKAVKGSAGAVFMVWGVQQADFINCRFEENNALESGGAIYAKNGSFCKTIDCTFTGNSAGKLGGALYICSTLQATNCTIANNTAGGNGGGICTGGMGTSNNRRPRMTLDGCTIENNTSGSQGGGIYLLSGSYATVSNTVLTGNKANAEGGAVWAVDDLTMHAVTATGNVSGGEGYAVYLGAAEYDGVSYYRGFHRISGEMKICDNEGGDLYLGKQTAVAIGEEMLTGDSLIKVKLHSGLLTQLLYGAYNYEGANGTYTVTTGDRSITDPEYDENYMKTEDEAPAEDTVDATEPVNEELPQGTGVVYIVIAAFVAVAAAVVAVVLAAKKKAKK